jgi:hypothetical protein
MRAARKLGAPVAVVAAAIAWGLLRGVDHRFISFSDGAYMYAASFAAAHGLHELYRTIAVSLPPAVMVSAALLWRASPHVETIRLALATASGATALLTYLVARRLFALGSTPAFLAAIVALTAPIHAQFVGLEGEVLITPLALLLSLTLEQRGRAASVAVMAIGFLVKLTWAPFFIAGAFAQTARFGRRTAGLTLLAAASAAAAVYAAAVLAFGWPLGHMMSQLVLAERHSGLQLDLFPRLALATAVLWWPMVALAPIGLRRAPSTTLYVMGGGAASALFMLKQGTFFNVLDPLEPFLAILYIAGAQTVWGRRRATGRALVVMCCLGLALHVASVSSGSLARRIPLPIGGAVVNTDNARTVNRLARVIDANSTPAQPVLVNPLLALAANRTEAAQAADWFILSSCGDGCRKWSVVKRMARRGQIAVVSVDSNVEKFDPSFRRDTGISKLRRVIRVHAPPLDTAIYVRPGPGRPAGGR